MDSIREWELSSRLSRLCFTRKSDEILGFGLDGNVYIMSLTDKTSKVQREFVSKASLNDAVTTSRGQTIALSAGSVIEIDHDNSQFEVKELWRCEAATSTVASNSDGDLIVGCRDGRLYLVWNADGRNEPQIVAKFGSSITALTSTGNGELLVALSDGRLLRIDITNSTIGWNVQLPTKITAGMLLPDSRLGIAMDADGWLHMFDLRTRKQLRTQRVSDSAIWSVASDRKETILATVGEDQQLRCWSLPSLELLFERKVDWGVRDVCVSPDGQWVAAAPPVDKEFGQQEGTIGIWNVATGECDRLLRGHDNWVLKLACTADARLISSGENRVVNVWDTDRGDSLVRISTDRSAAELIALNHAGDTLLLGHRDGWITSWNLADGKPLRSWSAFGDALTGLHTTDDDRLLATSRSSPLLRVFALNQADQVAELEQSCGAIHHFRLTKRGKEILLLGEDRQLLFTQLPLTKL